MRGVIEELWNHGGFTLATSPERIYGAVDQDGMRCYRDDCWPEENEAQRAGGRWPWPEGRVGPVQIPALALDIFGMVDRLPAFYYSLITLCLVATPSWNMKPANVDTKTHTATAALRACSSYPWSPRPAAAAGGPQPRKPGAL